MKHEFVRLKNGKEIKVLSQEVQILRQAGKLMDEEQTREDPQRGQPEPGSEKKSAWKLPILTTYQRRHRIRKAKRLKRKGYSVREIARRIGVSHVAILRWFKK